MVASDERRPQLYASTGSSVGASGSPIGPLEKSQVGLAWIGIGIGGSLAGGGMALVGAGWLPP